MVITVPGPFIIERNEKQVGLFELLQHLLASGLTGYSIAERPVQAIEDGGLQQERTDMLRLLAQHFFGLSEPSPTFLKRLGNVVILPHKNETVWWYEGGTFAMPFRSHHGGLVPEEMEIPLIVLPL